MNNKSRRVKSSGWAAFDLKQRQKDGEGDGKDPFPAIGDLAVTGGLRRNNDVGGLSFKSFSSVLQPPASPGFPAVKTQNVNNLTATVADFSAGYRDCDKVIEEKNDGNVLLDLKSLKEIHGWADFSLIEDVMSSVDNDAAKAFVLLNEMVSNADFDEDEGAKFNSGFNKSLADLSSTLENALKYNDHNNDKNNNNDKIYMDNSLVIASTKNLVFHGINKHIDTKFHYLRDCITNNKVEVKYVRTQDQVADIFTKPLKHDVFAKMRDTLGVTKNDDN